MSCVDYCTVLPSWDFEKDPAEIVTYFFGQECRHVAGEEDDSDLSSSQCTVDFRKTLCLKSTETDSGENEPLVISVTCKPQYRVSVCGIHVVSNTRIVELYDTSEGYLCSVRGSVLDTPLDEEGGEETETVYRCRRRLEEAQFGLSIKFPKTGNLSLINIYQIVLILHPELEDDHPEPSCNGMINMAKVKDYVTGMGDNISDNARMLMKNVEEYQKVVCNKHVCGRFQW
ncbi:hypothetical protein FSP39_014505 [Pinctada imbricata]|uniref:Uncharacterized protein n=1 Tax=Pinctada imbricata TaxID=66713 RepID=A0AA88Y057_PINIB|nr:hypothetical protein FSP39_014505 [Pinctada imbricata]